MRYYVEDRLANFSFWSGGKDTADALTEEQLDSIEKELEAITPEEGWSDSAINDLFWFEEDFIARLIGYKSFEHLVNDVTDEEVSDADDWFESLVDDKDWDEIDSVSDCCEIDLHHKDDEDDEEWRNYQNEEASTEWWDSLSDVKKVLIYREN